MCGSSGQPNADIRKQPFASPEKLREIVTATYKNLKQRKTTVQRSMSLYLANRDTEYILFKPLKVRSLCFIVLNSFDVFVLLWHCSRHGWLVGGKAVPILRYCVLPIIPIPHIADV